MYSDCDCYMIVIDDDVASNYYYEYCKSSWNSAGIAVNRFSAITPSQLSLYNELKFSKYSSSLKYVNKNIKAEISETEKACWYSHFSLWANCAFSKKPTLVLEHDSFLLDHNKLWRDDKYGIIFYDKAAMGSYLLQPWLASILVNNALMSNISYGPYWFIASIGDKLNIKHLIVNDTHRKYKAASNQVMCPRYGNTIEHYSNKHPDLFPQDKFSHQFMLIE